MTAIPSKSGGLFVKIVMFCSIFTSALLVLLKICSFHEVNNYASFELNAKNNITFVHTLLEAPNLIDDISTFVPCHANKNFNILVGLNSLKLRKDITID